MERREEQKDEDQEEQNRGGGGGGTGGKERVVERVCLNEEVIASMLISLSPDESDDVRDSSTVL